MIDSDGSYFIDRDGELFQVVLTYLRTGDVRIPPNIDEEALKKESEFYLIQIPPRQVL